MAVKSATFTTADGREFTIAPCKPAPGIQAILMLARYATVIFPVLQDSTERRDGNWARVAVELLAALQPVAQPDEIIQWCALVSGIEAPVITDTMTFADLVPLIRAVAVTNDLAGMFATAVNPDMMPAAQMAARAAQLQADAT